MQKTVAYTLLLLEEIDLDFVLKISQEQFGNGFLDESLLRTYLDNKDKFCHVVKDSKQVLGFSLMEIGARNEIANKMKGQKQWFLDYFSAYNRIAYRSLTAVSTSFEGRGVASFLVKEGLVFLSDKAELVVCDAWKSDSTHIGNILERNAYKAVKEVPFYWASESIHNQYQCSLCAAPPCKCTAVIYAKYFNKKTSNWWQRSSLKYEDGLLTIAKTKILDFIKNKDTPLYIYDVDRMVAKYEDLYTTLAQFQVNFSIYYAMKANRHPAILSHLLARTTTGIDVCSPNELDRALQYGFKEKQLTYTGTSLSNKELEKLSKFEKLKINFDSLSAVRRFINLDVEREIGIRINPNIGMAYNQGLEYSGNKIVKFGIYPAQWAALKTLLVSSSLTVTTVHCHCGSGFLNNQLGRLSLVFEQIDEFIKLFPTVKTLNLGGGLGVPQNQGDELLDLTQWASIICSYAQKRGLNLAFEPGDYLVKDAGILVTEVNTVEEKMGKHFLGINAGMNINNEYAYYKMNLEAVPVVEPTNAKKVATTICGNINEPVDLFAEDKPMPLLQEGDYIALLNSGGYGASSSSNHCMRGDFKEYILVDLNN